jgi:hypothetical protein
MKERFYAVVYEKRECLKKYHNVYQYIVIIIILFLFEIEFVQNISTEYYLFWRNTYHAWGLFFNLNVETLL